MFDKNKSITKLDKDIELCRECIVHWKNVIKNCHAPVAENCSFCNIYHKDKILPTQCRECPIYLDTDSYLCERTNYQNALDEYEYERNETTERTKMLNYLKDLLKKLISKKYDYYKIMQENTVVHCDTEEKAKDLLEWADTCGLKWSSGARYSQLTYWEQHKDNGICYYFLNDIKSSLSFFKAKNSIILTPEDVRINTGDSYLLKEESKPEIEKICKTCKWGGGSIGFITLNSCKGCKEIREKADKYKYKCDRGSEWEPIEEKKSEIETGFDIGSGQNYSTMRYWMLSEPDKSYMCRCDTSIKQEPPKIKLPDKCETCEHEYKVKKEKMYNPGTKVRIDGIIYTIIYDQITDHFNLLYDECHRIVYNGIKVNTFNISLSELRKHYPSIEIVEN